MSNGSLYFPPFDAENFREDVHWTTYRCSALNTIGTIVSKDTVVKAGKITILTEDFNTNFNKVTFYIFCFNN